MKVKPGQGGKILRRVKEVGPLRERRDQNCSGYEYFDNSMHVFLTRKTWCLKDLCEIIYQHKLGEQKSDPDTNGIDTSINKWDMPVFSEIILS